MSIIPDFSGITGQRLDWTISRVLEINFSPQFSYTITKKILKSMDSLAQDTDEGNKLELFNIWLENPLDEISFINLYLNCSLPERDFLSLLVTKKFSLKILK